jgi:hypothetical protein
MLQQETHCLDGTGLKERRPAIHIDGKERLALFADGEIVKLTLAEITVLKSSP